MIDYSNEIFNLIATELRKKYKGIKVIGENIDIPTEFPTVTVDEVKNTPTSIDTSELNKFAHVRYRVQVFSNNTNGKRAECRQIYKTVDEILQKNNLTCKAFNTLPTVYNSKIYQIDTLYEAIISQEGYIYKN